MLDDVEMRKYIFVVRVEIHRFGMPNVCEECRNHSNSYVHLYLPYYREYQSVIKYWLASEICVFVSRHFWESDVSTGLNVGIVQSFNRGHLQRLCVIFKVTEDLVHTEPTAKRTGSEFY